MEDGDVPLPVASQPFVPAGSQQEADDEKSDQEDQDQDRKADQEAEDEQHPGLHGAGLRS